MQALAQDRASPAASIDEAYRAVFEASRDGLIVTDLETGRILAANKLASAMHGYSRDAFVGLLQTSLLPPNSAERFTDYVHALLTGSLFDGRALHLRRDGSAVDVDLRVTAVPFQGRPCLLSSVRDASQQVQAERFLDREVEARTREQTALAVLQERQHLARNLHDAVNQSLFSAGLIAEVLPRLWERDPIAGRLSLEDLRRLTRGALAELRALLGELRPSVLIDTDLGDLLRQLGNALTGRADIPVTVSVTGHGRLPEEVQVTLYRICQEALNNIAKHTPEAKRVDIQLQYEAGAVEIRIHDDGRGFEPDHTPAGHMGLSMMRERAEAIGATLSLTSRSGAGTEIKARWTAAAAGPVGL